MYHIIPFKSETDIRTKLFKILIESEDNFTNIENHLQELKNGEIIFEKDKVFYKNVEYGLMRI